LNVKRILSFEFLFLLGAKMRDWNKPNDEPDEEKMDNIVDNNGEDESEDTTKDEPNE
jgi:hypothetical protein